MQSSSTAAGVYIGQKHLILLSIKSQRAKHENSNVFLQKSYFKKLRDFQSIHIFFGVFGRHFPEEIKGSQKKQLHV